MLLSDNNIGTREIEIKEICLPEFLHLLDEVVHSNLDCGLIVRTMKIVHSWHSSSWGVLFFALGFDWRVTTVAGDQVAGLHWSPHEKKKNRNPLKNDVLLLLGDSIFYVFLQVKNMLPAPLQRGISGRQPSKRVNYEY